MLLMLIAGCYSTFSPSIFFWVPDESGGSEITTVLSFPPWEWCQRKMAALWIWSMSHREVYRFQKTKWLFDFVAEVVEQTSDWNTGGGCKEGGAHSRGIFSATLCLSVFLSICQACCQSLSSVSLTGSSGQPCCPEWMWDLWSNSFPHGGKHWPEMLPTWFSPLYARITSALKPLFKLFGSIMTKMSFFWCSRIENEITEQTRPVWLDYWHSII